MRYLIKKDSKAILLGTGWDSSSQLCLLVRYLLGVCLQEVVPRKRNDCCK